jgi:hypothetical protein
MSRLLIIIEHHGDDADPVACGSCDWTGTAGDVEEVTDCILTAGDASPVGRCPECDSLAYLVRPVDLAQNAVCAVFHSNTQTTRVALVNALPPMPQNRPAPSVEPPAPVPVYFKREGEIADRPGVLHHIHDSGGVALANVQEIGADGALIGEAVDVPRAFVVAREAEPKPLPDFGYAPPPATPFDA